MTIQHRLWAAFGLVLMLGLLSSAAVLRADDSQRPMQTHDFTDVPVADKAWMEEYINAFYHQGITTGCNPAPLQYCPEATLTRAEMAVFIGRSLGYVQMGTDGYAAKAYFKHTANGHGVVGRSHSGVGAVGYSNLGYGVSATSLSGTGLFAAGTGDLIADTHFDVYMGGTLGELFAGTMSIVTNDDVTIELDNNDNENSFFVIRDGDNGIAMQVAEDGTTQIYGNTTIYGNHTITGAKNALVDTVHYGARLMYSVEATQAWFEDFGTGQLVDGAAVITIDPMYAETVNLTEDYHVYLTPIGEATLLYIETQTADSFTVRSANRSAAIRFHYRIVAKRLGYEEVRMEEVTD